MRHHFYYPVVKNGHALLSAARIWFLEPHSDDLITQDVWDTQDGGNTLPNPWTASPGIIDVWFTFPQRLRLKVQEYLGSTYYIEDIDILPSANDIIYAGRHLAIIGGWNINGMLTALTNNTAQWSTVHVITPGDTPITVPVGDLAPGEGNPFPAAYVNQSVTWTRLVQDVSAGFSPPTEIVQFRQSTTTYIQLAIYVDPGSQIPLAVCQRYVAGALTTTYFNTLPTNIAFPVNGETMVATITDAQVCLYQDSVSSTAPVASFMVDITPETGHSFFATYLDNSDPQITIDNTVWVNPVWTSDGGTPGLFPNDFVYPADALYPQ